MGYQITSGAIRWLRTRALKAQRADQHEVCGLIISKDRVQLELMHLSNESSVSLRFFVSAESHKTATSLAKARGFKVLGAFHSHPVGEAVPSPRDLQLASRGSSMLIYDVCGREARLWKILKSKMYIMAEVRLETIGPKPRRRRK